MCGRCVVVYNCGQSQRNGNDDDDSEHNDDDDNNNGDGDGDTPYVRTHCAVGVAA